jgi:hypothetical protein
MTVISVNPTCCYDENCETCDCAPSLKITLSGWTATGFGGECACCEVDGEWSISKTSETSALCTYEDVFTICSSSESGLECRYVLNLYAEYDKTNCGWEVSVIPARCHGDTGPCNSAEGGVYRTYYIIRYGGSGSCHGEYILSQTFSILSNYYWFRPCNSPPNTTTITIEA